eukprot:CAMPEP_0181139916 /NCGR_PEP_ID=MMETSP1071-20121207/35033_1 /TAXON_ID=35127 /ORGANISM="Thalassiosira sp., Strain NH16" /LENGTH=166 /DNA_ID=CAMNT_0023226847 /DNA_START=62 /DNA_END=562 /DNA_ORIENTATION=+
MKSFLVNLVVASCALNEGIAFSTLPRSRPSPSSVVAGRQTSLPAATVGGSNPLSNDAGVKPVHPPTFNDGREMETIRLELVQKYIALGHTEDYATREVDYFLEDSERSNEYVEMRRVAMARGNDLGIENIIQFAAAFMVGMMGSWVLNSLHALHAANADGAFPWIS